MDGLTIQQFVQQTGVPEGTLRMWERRHQFPAPRRLPGGHRRYSQGDVELVQRVARDRAAGITLAAAIARATDLTTGSPGSVFATLRRRRADLDPRTLSKPMLLAITHAIEDESLARAEQSLIFASFQSERFYRQAQPRWRRLARSADLTVVFADFDHQSALSRGPIEVPVTPTRALSQEWNLVFWAPRHAVCLSAWQPPARDTRTSATTAFEVIWSVEPDIVHQAATVCADITADSIPPLKARLSKHLQADPGPPTADQLRLAAAITNRTLAYLS